MSSTEAGSPSTSLTTACASCLFPFPTYFSFASLTRTPWRSTNHINRKTCAISDSIPHRCTRARSATTTKRVDFWTPLEPSWASQTFSLTSSEAHLQFGPTKGRYTDGVSEAVLFRVAPETYTLCVVLLAREGSAEARL